MLITVESIIKPLLIGRYINLEVAKYPCGIFHKAVTANDKAVHCESCNTWVHIACNGTSIDDYELWVWFVCNITNNLDRMNYQLIQVANTTR